MIQSFYAFVAFECLGEPNTLSVTNRPKTIPTIPVACSSIKGALGPLDLGMGLRRSVGVMAWGLGFPA